MDDKEKDNMELEDSSGLLVPHYGMAEIMGKDGIKRIYVNPSSDLLNKIIEDERNKK